MDTINEHLVRRALAVQVGTKTALLQVPDGSAWRGEVMSLTKIAEKRPCCGGGGFLT
jgi:hypothetical protein